MIGQIKYKGIHSSLYDVYWKSTKRPLMPAIKRKTITVNGSSGIYDFGDNEYESVKISGKIIYISNNIYERKQRARQISAWLSSIKWEKLFFGDEPDKYYLARVDGQVDLDALISSGEANITFICQPFAYRIIDTAENLTWEEADIPWITAEIPWAMSDAYTFVATGAKSYTFDNPGTKEINYKSPQGSKSKIIINGSWSKLSFNMNNKTINYNESGTGELVIDNVEMEVELNGINKLGAISGDLSTFFEIEPGENTLNISGTGLSITVTIDFAPMWL